MQSRRQMASDVAHWLKFGGMCLADWLHEGRLMVRDWFVEPVSQQEMLRRAMEHIRQHMDALSGVSSIARGDNPVSVTKGGQVH